MFRQILYLFIGLFLLACGNSDNIAEPEDLSSSSIEKSKKSSSSNKSQEKTSSSGKSSSSQSIYNAQKNTLTDLRDGQTYRTVTIGTQVWMAENLNYKTDGSYCLHDKANSCSKYGRLYNWGTAMDSAGVFSNNGKGCGYTKTCTPTYPTRGICPEGWHIPTASEFKILIQFAGAIDNGGYRFSDAALKLKSTTGWDNYYITDEFGFSALPAGIRHIDTYVEGTTSFWTSLEYQDTKSGNYFAYYRMFNLEATYEDFAYGKLSALSVRCLKDEPSESGNPDTLSSKSGVSTSKPLHVSSGTLTDSRDGKTYRTLTINEQTWMAENLNYKTTDSYCNDSCDKYGLLYSWMDALINACPTGWRLPTKAEFNELIEAVGDKETAGTILKSTSGWNDIEEEPLRDENGCPKYRTPDPEDYREPGEKCIHEYLQSWNGIDVFNFTVLPAGSARYMISDSSWFSTPPGSHAYFLTSSGGAKFFSYKFTQIFDENGRHCSVRCIKADISAVPKDAKGSMKDSRDGQTYSTVKIGKQTWMAENLNYKTDNSYCYNDSSVYCEKYGRLYTWDAAMEACPSGWHLPTESEFNTLLSSVDKSKSAKELKSTTGWYDKGENGNGTDKYGFSVLPSGYKPDVGAFLEMGGFTVFWGSTKEGRQKATSLAILYNDDKAYVGFRPRLMEYGYSVRCLKD